MPVVQCARHHLGDRQTVEDGRHVVQHPAVVRPLLGQCRDLRQQTGGVQRGQTLQQRQHMAVIQRAEHGGDIFAPHLAMAEGDRLIGQTHGVTHRAIGGLAEQPQRVFLEADFLAGENVGQVLDHAHRRHVLERELQAARQDGDRQLLRISGREQELHVGRRLFQRLEQRIETVGRQHVHLIDEVHLVAALGRRVLDVVQQLTRILDLGPRGGVDFDQVDEAALIDLTTGATHATRPGADTLFTVQALGQNARQRRLADTAGPGEQIGMVQAPLIEGIDQRTADMLLTDQFVKIARAPLARQYLIAH